MSIFKSKIDPRTARDNISPQNRCLFLSVESLRDFVVAGEHALVLAAQNSETSGPNIWASGNYAMGFFGLGDSRLIEARNALAILEASAEYLEAKAIVEPIIAAVAKLEADEEQARQVRQAKLSALTVLQDAAIAAAMAKAQKDPAVVAAQAELAALNAV